MSDDDQNDQLDPGDFRRKLEEANARAAAAEAAANELRAKNVFRDAGLDPSQPLHQALMDGYKGEMDTIAVKEWFTGLGMTNNTPPPTPTPAAPVVGEDEAAALEAMTDAQRGAGGPPPSPSDRDRLAKELDELPWNAPPHVRNELLMKFSEAGGFKVVRE